MAKIKKSLAMILVIALIIGIVAFGLVYSATIFPDDAPTGVMTVILTNEDTGHKWQAIVEINQDTLTQTVFGSKEVSFEPLTAFEVDVPFLEPLTPYSIQFYITIKATPPEGITFLNGTVSIMGEKYISLANIPWDGDAGFRDNQATDGSGANPTGGLPETLSVLQPMTPLVEEQFIMPPFNWLSFTEANTEYNHVIWGQWVNNSTFHIQMIVDGGPTSFGSTEADVTIKTGPGGDITIELTNIDATAT